MFLYVHAYKHIHKVVISHCILSVKSFSLSLMASNVTLMLTALVLVSQISLLHFRQPMETLYLETLLSLHVEHIQKLTHNFPY